MVRLRGLEPADVISTMFIAAHGRKVSGLTIFAETKNNSESTFSGLPKVTFPSSNPLSPAMQSSHKHASSALCAPQQSRPMLSHIRSILKRAGVLNLPSRLKCKLWKCQSKLQPHATKSKKGDRRNRIPAPHAL